MKNPDYDVIVIGSGAGGMAAAVPLAQAGLSLLVCEQHDVPGGWCHSFTLEGYRFSPGVHYIGRLGPGESLRKIYEGLGVSEDLQFCEINPDGYDHIFIGEERFDIPKGRERFADRLKARFPAEAAGIDGYFNAVTDLVQGVKQAARIKSPGDLVKTSPVLRWGLKTGQDLIDAFVSDPVLKAILAGQSGDHGMPPSQVSAPVHAGIVDHYFNGGYYPVGGGFAIPRAFARALRRAGGELRLQTAVKQIIIENGSCVGVQLGDGTEIRSRYVISNADPEMTYRQLIGEAHLSRKLIRKLNRVTYSTSAISLFLAVDMDLRAAGMDSGNFWFYDHADINEIYRQGQTDAALYSDPPPAIFLTATTLKDPSKMHSGHHTLEAFTFVSYDAFENWAGSDIGARPQEYEQIKSNLANRMLNAIERRIPGFKQHVVFCSLGTPLTNKHYLYAHRGNLYGIDKSRLQVGPGAFPIQTEINGLFMCGASTLSHGVAGATATGLTAARRILKCSHSDLLKMNGPELQIYPSEDPSVWPTKQRRRMRGQGLITEEST